MCYHNAIGVQILESLNWLPQGGGVFLVPFQGLVFSAPEPKAQVHYCDHVLSVVRRR